MQITGVCLLKVTNLKNEKFAEMNDWTKGRLQETWKAKEVFVKRVAWNL